jgi:excisionase family DNA binding protein
VLTNIDPPDIAPRMLTVKQAAAYINGTVWTIRELIWSGELPVIKRKGYLIDKADLDAWIDRTKKRL